MSPVVATIFYGSLHIFISYFLLIYIDSFLCSQLNIKKKFYFKYEFHKKLSRSNTFKFKVLLSFVICQSLILLASVGFTVSPIFFYTYLIVLSLMNIRWLSIIPLISLILSVLAYNNLLKDFIIIDENIMELISVSLTYAVRLTVILLFMKIVRKAYEDMNVVTLAELMLILIMLVVFLFSQFNLTYFQYCVDALSLPSMTNLEAITYYLKSSVNMATILLVSILIARTQKRTLNYINS